MDHNPNAVPPPLPECGKRALTKSQKGPHLWQIFASLAPAVVLAAAFIFTGGRTSKSEAPFFIGTIIWCGCFALPLSGPVKNIAGRIVLYLVLFPGLVIVNLAAGFFAGCCLSIFKSH